MNEALPQPRLLIVIGGSAGAVEALVQLVQHLPAQFVATVLVVVHIQARRWFGLPLTLQAWSVLPILDAIDESPITPAHIYIAPPDYHLLVGSERVQVVMGAKEHGFRPAIDPLFRTAARFHRDRVVGVLLSGALWDGTAGLAEIKACGGITIVQDPQQACVPSMPQTAINYGVVDHILPVAEIAQLLVTLAQGSAIEEELE
ncbi:chemotaxis protein CheB [Leptolyngbya sp. AN03gr2]|uniref:chemotaxis protein CheB n=1 Tax=unclassified Leptolyngbya TaxID=2650499 RepID=UPI003D316DAF